MLDLAEARQRILSHIAPARSESSGVNDSVGRFLAADIHAPQSLPPFDNSAMDGYAIRAADVAAASSNNPVALRLIGAIPAGEGFPAEVLAGSCVRIFTGSVLPPG